MEHESPSDSADDFAPEPATANRPVSDDASGNAPDHASADTPSQEAPPAAPLHGMPAHRATSELSLDHVFKGNAAPRPDNEGFSFDRFFASEAAAAPPKASGDNRAPQMPADDIAQFNAWLNGLKKS
jgi:hypothetical protein